MRFSVSRFVAHAALCLMALLSLSTPAQTNSVQVDVVHRGEVIVIDVVLVAPVPVREAWAVLTDFNEMSRFVPDLESSRIKSRTGARLTVEQRGVARWGPFAQQFETVREVELVPYERVTSRVVSGSLRRADTQTRFVPLAEGTEIRHHIELITDMWLPDIVVGAFLRAEVRQQFDALVQEMRRRGPGLNAPR